MTVKQAIAALQKLPPNLPLGSYNPVFNETIYVSSIEVDETLGLVQVYFDGFDAPEGVEL